MNGKIRSAILGVVAGIAVVGFSSYADACTPLAFSDYMARVASDSKRIAPQDCAVVRISTPIISWAHDRNVTRPYSITVRRTSGGFLKTYTSNVPRLLVPDALASGTYEWKVTYNRATSSEVSAGRRFVIPSTGQFRIPTGLSFAEQVAQKGHPRTKVGSTDLKQVAELAKREFGLSYAAYIAKANALLAETIPGVPANDTEQSFIQRYGTIDGKARYSQWLIDLRNLSIAQARNIKMLGYAYHFTGDGRYLNNGLERLQRLADWPSDPGDATSHKTQDQANREIFLALALGMDLFHAQLSSTTYAPWQTKIANSFKKRIAQVDFSSFNTFPKDSHLLTVSRYAMEAMMYAIGANGVNDQASKDLFVKQWEMWITTLGSWGENIDGGFGNGEYYGWMNALGVIQGAVTARLIANVDLTKWDLVGKTGEYLIAVSPAKILTRQHFGDAAEHRNNYQQYSKDVRLLAMLSGNPAYDWYWRQDKSNVYYSSWELGIDNYLVLALHGGAPDFSAGKTLGLKNSYHFKEAGFVAMHSSTTEQLRSSVLFRSSEFGSFSHNHADQNSFTFTSKGQPILINAGYYDYSGSPHHLFITRATRFKNALTFNNGIGQAERTNDGNPTYPGIPLDSSETRGSIKKFVDNNVWAVAVGDATMAYQGFDPNVAGSTWKRYMDKAYRTVAYNRTQGVVVIYDYAVSSKNRQWELNFHSINPPTLDGTSLSIANNGAKACLDVYARNRTMRRSHFTEWPALPGRYYDKALIPANKGNPNGDHSWADLVGKPVAPVVSTYYPRPLQSHTIFYDDRSLTRTLTAVTVIREDCRKIPVSVTWSSTSSSMATVKINNGSALIMNGLSVTVPAQ